MATLPGSSFCPDLSSTQGREDRGVKWSAKLLFGSWQFEASMWEDSWEREVWIQKTPAGDALWQNQTWQAEASTSAAISKQRSQTTYSMLLRCHRVSKEEKAYGQATRESLPWVVEVTQASLLFLMKQGQLSPAMVDWRCIASVYFLQTNCTLRSFHRASQWSSNNLC